MLFLKNIYLPNRFFVFLGAVAVLFTLGVVIKILFPIAQALLVLGAALCILDAIIIFNRSVVVDVSRDVPKVLSLGDKNNVTLHLRNRAPFPLNMTIIDELPFQLQRRDFEMAFALGSDEKKEVKYTMQPFIRGEYEFGVTNVYIRTPFLGLLERRIAAPTAGITPVYPSIMQMKRFELKAFSRISTFDGIKRQRRLGHSYEFEQIKNYVRGDTAES
jgi:uncharacterized protein (DUF58 family)